MPAFASRILACLFPLLLGSCSYSYSLKAVAIEGRLAFVVDSTSSRGASCIRSIEVSVDDDGPKAQPEPGDDVALVTRGGVYWWDFRAVGTCENDFPVYYGAPLKGPPARESIGQVKPKPLKRGVLYQVTTTGSGSGSGSGWFRISPDGRIESYVDDPTPPIRDDNGYVSA
ncbi:hypothetical protein [Stakelama tenebrarum]|nr:hypothetical protein [Sphingosinithalassobacter tenebrarum]